MAPTGDADVKEKLSDEESLVWLRSGKSEARLCGERVDQFRCLAGPASGVVGLRSNRSKIRTYLKSFPPGNVLRENVRSVPLAERTIPLSKEKMGI